MNHVKRFFAVHDDRIGDALEIAQGVLPSSTEIRVEKIPSKMGEVLVVAGDGSDQVSQLCQKICVEFHAQDIRHRQVEMPDLNEPKLFDIRENSRSHVNRELPTAELLGLLPASVAHDMGILPVGGELRISDRFYDHCAQLVLLTPRPLTAAQRETLQFVVPNCSFDYVCPEHPEFARYRDIAENIPEYLAKYYPAGELSITY